MYEADVDAQVGMAVGKLVYVICSTAAHHPSQSPTAWLT